MHSTRPSLLSRFALLSLFLSVLFTLPVREAGAQAPITISKDPAQWALIY